MRKALLLLLTCLAASGTALAQSTNRPSEVDQAEILRRGNYVQYVSDEAQSGTDGDYGDPLAPPASDADKWFISVFTMRGCGGCEQLKRDWATSQWLLALAHPSQPKQSWSHYNVYSREDKSQAFRCEKLKITVFPTVVVQPPRSGRYGSANTVVFQQTYSGNPKELAQQITRAIRLYVSKLQAPRQATTQATGDAADCYPNGIDPPWQPNPKDDPFAPLFPPSDQPFRIPPDEAYGPSLVQLVESAIKFVVIGALLVAGGMGGFAIVIYLLRLRRESAARQGQLQEVLAELLASQRQARQKDSAAGPANG